MMCDHAERDSEQYFRMPLLGVLCIFLKRTFKNAPWLLTRGEGLSGVLGLAG